jgi:hypothetical protein
MNRVRIKDLFVGSEFFMKDKENPSIYYRAKIEHIEEDSFHLSMDGGGARKHYKSGINKNELVYKID